MTLNDLKKEISESFELILTQVQPKSEMFVNAIKNQVMADLNKAYELGQNSKKEEDDLK